MARTKRSRPARKPLDRFAMMTELRQAATDKWARSDNPVKRRIGRLEVAWREGIQMFAEDIQAMFANFATIGDAYDKLDINIAAIKALLIEKKVFTEEEFVRKTDYLTMVLNVERRRRQDELARLQKEAEEAQAEDAELRAQVAQAEAQATDGSKVTPELRQMHQAAKAAGASDELAVPAGATVFGG